MGRGDSEAQDVGELGVNGSGRFRGIVSGHLLPAGDRLQAATNHPHDLLPLAFHNLRHLKLPR